jgi:hypothetical protein
VKAHAILFFEDDQGVSHPNIENNVGTGKLSSSGTTVTGASTVFTSQLQEGDLILADDQVRRVVSITDDGSPFGLEVDVAFLPALTTEEFIFQKYTILNPALASVAVENAVVVQTTARDFGKFEAVDVKFLFNEVDPFDTIDIAFPYLTNEIGKSLNLGDNTIPRNKQREYKLYRMAVANPDVFTGVEAGLVGANVRVEAEAIALSGVEFTVLANRNLFPFSEVVFRSGIKSKGTIQYIAQPADGDMITVGPLTYEFDSTPDPSTGDPPVSIATGDYLVTIGLTPEATFQNLVDLINVTSAATTASHNSIKHTVTIQALLPGVEGNSIIFAQDCLVVKLTPAIGTLDDGVDGVEYTRGDDYIIRYDDGEIARTSQGAIRDPSSTDLVVTYSYFPGEVPLNTSYSQTIKPVGVKLEIDPTCLFFFRGRKADFNSPDAININFEVVERTPDRFTYLKPKVRGHYQQVVHFSATLPHRATLDYAAMVDREAVLIKTTGAGITTSIPFDQDGWTFFSETEVELSTGTKYLSLGETALFDAEAEYEISYCVKFQFTTAPIRIADVSSAYALLPYAYKTRFVEEKKEDVEQVLILNTLRQAKLKLPAIQDQALAELTSALGGDTEILSDDTWGFVDKNTVEIFLGTFNFAAIYTLTYKSSKLVITTGPDCEPMELDGTELQAGSLSVSGTLVAILTPPPSSSSGLVGMFVSDTVDNAGSDKIGFDGFVWSSTSDAQSQTPLAFTATDLTVRLSAALAGTETLTITFYVNGSPSALAVTFNSGTTNVVTTTGASVTVADSDLVHFVATLGGGLVSATVRSVELGFEV